LAIFKKIGQYFFILLVTVVVHHYFLNNFRLDFKAKVDGVEKEYHWIGKFPPASPGINTIMFSLVNPSGRVIKLYSLSMYGFSGQ
jgi:hypothetical protein